MIVGVGWSADGGASWLVSPETSGVAVGTSGAAGVGGAPEVCSATVDPVGGLGWTIGRRYLRLRTNIRPLASLIA